AGCDRALFGLGSARRGAASVAGHWLGGTGAPGATRLDPDFAAVVVHSLFRGARHLPRVPLLPGGTGTRAAGVAAGRTTFGRAAACIAGTAAATFLLQCIERDHRAGARSASRCCRAYAGPAFRAVTPGVALRSAASNSTARRAAVVASVSRY